MSLSIRDLLYITWRSLQENRLRSALTALGVFMGVASVNATLQIGDISTSFIRDQLEKRESPQVLINGTFKTEDLTYLKSRLTGLEALSGVATIAWETPITFETRSIQASVAAVTAEHLVTTGRSLLAGRSFSPSDLKTTRPVVLIDVFLEERLFKDRSGLKAKISIENRIFLVIGIIESKEIWGEQRGQVYLPMSFYQTLIPFPSISELALRPQKLEKINQLSEQAIFLLNSRYPTQEVYAYNNIEDLLILKQVIGYISLALLLLGLISLVVGGIGIANITIAAVAERTSEIGLKRSIGATQSDILYQFILEATLLSSGAALVATTFIYLIVLVVTNVFDLPYRFNPATVAISIVTAVTIGAGASYIPALRASKLDPITALRE